jgi:hypothetical protein
VALAARRSADPETADGVAPSGAPRSQDRPTVQLRRLSRTVAPGVDRERARAESLTPEPQPRIARETDRVAARQMAPATQISAETPASEPVAETTDPGRLAALTGGSLVNAPDGRTSVVFQSGGQQPSGSARAVRTATAHLARPEPAPATASIDVDELYDQIAARLRRELLLDRERAGELP